MLTGEDFWDKVDSEGGIDAAMDYGIRLDEYDIPDELKALWRQAADIIEAIRRFDPEAEWV